MIPKKYGKEAWPWSRDLRNFWALNANKLTVNIEKTNYMTLSRDKV